MGHISRTEVRDGVLWVYLSRVIDAGSMPADPVIFEKLHAECSERGCSSILFDARGADVRADWPSKLRGVFALAKAQVPGRRVAVLADRHSLSSHGALGNVGRLAGALICFFSDEEKALEWLDRASNARPDGPRAPTPADRAPEGRVQGTGEG